MNKKIVGLMKKRPTIVIGPDGISIGKIYLSVEGEFCQIKITGGMAERSRELKIGALLQIIINEKNEALYLKLM